MSNITKNFSKTLRISHDPHKVNTYQKDEQVTTLVDDYVIIRVVSVLLSDQQHIINCEIAPNNTKYANVVLNFLPTETLVFDTSEKSYVVDANYNYEGVLSLDDNTYYSIKWSYVKGLKSELLQLPTAKGDQELFSTIPQFSITLKYELAYEETDSKPIVWVGGKDNIKKKSEDKTDRYMFGTFPAGMASIVCSKTTNFVLPKNIVELSNIELKCSADEWGGAYSETLIINSSRYNSWSTFTYTGNVLDGGEQYKYAANVTLTDDNTLVVSAKIMKDYASMDITPSSNCKIKIAFNYTYQDMDGRIKTPRMEFGDISWYIEKKEEPTIFEDSTVSSKKDLASIGHTEVTNNLKILDSIYTWDFPEIGYNMSSQTFVADSRTTHLDYEKAQVNWLFVKDQYIEKIELGFLTRVSMSFDGEVIERRNENNKRIFFNGDTYNFKEYGTYAKNSKWEVTWPIIVSWGSEEFPTVEVDSATLSWEYDNSIPHSGITVDTINMEITSIKCYYAMKTKAITINKTFNQYDRVELIDAGFKLDDSSKVYKLMKSETSVDNNTVSIEYEVAGANFSLTPKLYGYKDLSKILQCNKSVVCKKIQFKDLGGSQ